MFIYESHLGGIIAYDSEQDDTFCETCGDSDWLIGEFDDATSFLSYYANEISVENGEGGVSLEHVLQVLGDSFDDCPSYDDAIDIILCNRDDIDDDEYYDEDEE